MFQADEAPPGKTGQYSAAAGITTRSGLQLLPPKPPSHRRITLKFLSTGGAKFSAFPIFQPAQSLNQIFF